MMVYIHLVGMEELIIQCCRTEITVLRCAPTVLEELAVQTMIGLLVKYLPLSSIVHGSKNLNHPYFLETFIVLLWFSR